jgi:putative mRNA 3-end processing factor
MATGHILKLTPAGLYCEEGDFHIDPVRKVARAVITHGHSDHARPGHDAVLATQPTLDVMQARYGRNYAKSPQPIRYGEVITLGSATIKLIPAGHVLGSAQVVVEANGERMVVSGDFKRATDPTCVPFEPVHCDVFVTEATFGLPIFRHPPASQEVATLLSSVDLFRDRTHFVAAYSLGKAQRMIAMLRLAGYDGLIHVDRATARLCEIYEHHGVSLGQLGQLESQTGNTLKGSIVIAPPSSREFVISETIGIPITSFASGWMRVKKRARAGGGDLPLIISDHADWPELTTTAREIAPRELWITHGEADALIDWASSNSMVARPLAIAGYAGEDHTVQ